MSQDDAERNQRREKQLGRLIPVIDPQLIDVLPGTLVGLEIGHILFKDDLYNTKTFVSTVDIFLVIATFVNNRSNVIYLFVHFPKQNQVGFIDKTYVTPI